MLYGFTLAWPECKRLTRGWITPAEASCICCSWVSQHLERMAAVDSAIMPNERLSADAVARFCWHRNEEVASSKVTMSQRCFSCIVYVSKEGTVWWVNDVI